MIFRAMELRELPTDEPPDEPSEYLKVKDEHGNPIENTQFKRETVMFPMKLKTWYGTQVELNKANSKLYYMLRGKYSLEIITKI